MNDVFSLRNESAINEHPVSIKEFLTGNTNAVRIETGEDIRQLLPHIDRIILAEISFPTFTDGRGYSAARILRETGYTGELRAQGDVLLDQIRYMCRCGFDSFAPQTPIKFEEIDEVLKRFNSVYQATVDRQNPIWNLRHES